jgi:hypothetical protein
MGNAFESAKFCVICGSPFLPLSFFNELRLIFLDKPLSKDTRQRLCFN